ncbi:MAG: phasin family protein [Actinomycetota bacterium]
MFDELRRIALVGSGVAELTRSRAEQMVKDLVKAGDIRREQAQTAVKDMLEMARANRRELLGLVRAEIQDQIANLGVANHRDVERLERRVARLEDANRKLKADLSAAQKDVTAARTAAAGAGTGSSMASRRASPKKTSAKKTTVRKRARAADAAKPAETGAGE